MGAIDQAVVSQVAAQASEVRLPANPVMLPVANFPPRPVTAQCIAAEAQKQKLDQDRLVAVLATENGRVGDARKASGGGFDLGPMQINTIHLAEFAKVFGISQAQLAYLLIYDGCFNVAVGAWHLRTRTNEVTSADPSTIYWFGIGRYHSREPSLSTTYLLRVHKTMNSLMKKGRQREE